MSAQQYFSEVEAVVQELQEFVGCVRDDDGQPVLHGSYLGGDQTIVLGDEEFAAIWQAAELLSRAHAVLVPMIQLDMNKYALNIPDPQTEQPKQPKAARLYDGQGRPIA